MADSPGPDDGPTTDSGPARRLPDLGPTLQRARASLARARQRGEADRWLQVNVALFLQGKGNPPYTPWASLSTAVEEWRAAGRFAGCFFVRKEPGLRLRFWGDNLAEKLEPELLVWLRTAEQQNQIRSFRLVPYEPEQHLFGGPTGMVLAHRQFNRDAGIALRYEALPQDDRDRLPDYLFSLAVLNDLFNRGVDDQGEVWDVWHRLRQARDVLPLPDPALDSQLAGVQAIAEQVPGVLERLPDSIQQLLLESREANEQTAQELRAASGAGRLVIGPRAWLMAVCIFNWNRLGLDPDKQMQLIGWMLQVLNPHAQRG
jgi:thiopeptide-type bacteriocin biosynthesis protein